MECRRSQRVARATKPRRVLRELHRKRNQRRTFDLSRERWPLGTWGQEIGSPVDHHESAAEIAGIEKQDYLRLFYFKRGQIIFSKLHWVVDIWLRWQSMNYQSALGAIVFGHRLTVMKALPKLQDLLRNKNICVCFISKERKLMMRKPLWNQN